MARGPPFWQRRWRSGAGSRLQRWVRTGGQAKRRGGPKAGPKGQAERPSELLGEMEDANLVGHVEDGDLG